MALCTSFVCFGTLFLVFGAGMGTKGFLCRTMVLFLRDEINNRSTEMGRPDESRPGLQYQRCVQKKYMCVEIEKKIV